LHHTATPSAPAAYPLTNRKQSGRHDEKKTGV
jgi:hypothetical protein